MILEPHPGLRVFFKDPDPLHPLTGWGTIKTVFGPLFVTVDMDDFSEVGAYTSELSTSGPAQTSTPATL